jgi:HEAT repeat protein
MMIDSHRGKRDDEAFRFRPATARRRQVDPGPATHPPSPEVRYPVVVALRDIPARSASDLLIAALADPAVDVRRQAAISLTQLRHAAAIPALRRHCRTDGDALVRRLALEALGVFHGPARLGDFLGALSDTDGEVRAAAAKILGRSGLRPAVPALRRALQDRSDKVRAEAALALRRLRADTAVRPS